MSKADIVKLADGKRTAADIAAELGFTKRYVKRVGVEFHLFFAPDPDEPGRGNHSKLCVETFKSLVSKGLYSDQIAAQMRVAVETVRKLARRNGVKIAQRPKVHHPRRDAKPAPPPPPRPQSVEEWLAIHGKPRKFEPGTLDQILADTFASVGKALTYSGGKGTSWTPYRIGKRNMNKGQVIAEANKIRAEQGKPLLNAPRRPSPKNARSLSFGRASA